MGTGKGFTTRECFFHVVPGDTFLFATGLPYIPTQGMFVEYTDFETSVVTTYSVQDVILEVEEKPAVPPGSPGQGHPVVHIPRWRVEIQVVP